MNRTWSQLVRGMDRPQLILVDNLMWAAYMQSLQTIQRITNSNEGNLGFPAIKYMDADVVLDGGIGGDAPSTTAYFLNLKYMFYRPHRDRNMVALDPGKRYSVNQDAVTQLIAWAGNLTTSGAQFQGQLNNS